MVLGYPCLLLSGMVAQDRMVKSKWGLIEFCSDNVQELLQALKRNRSAVIFCGARELVPGASLAAIRSTLLEGEA